MKRTRIMQVALVTISTLLITGLAVNSATANLPDCSNCIEAGDIATGAVNAAELDNDLDDSITANDLASSSVGAAEVAAGAIGASELASSVETNVVAGYHDALVELPSGTGFETAGQLSIPAGKWVILAKLWMENNDVGQGAATITCRLTAGADTDESTMDLAGNARGIFNTMVVHTFVTAGAAVFACDDGVTNGDMHIEDIKIIATRTLNATNAAI